MHHSRHLCKNEMCTYIEIAAQSTKYKDGYCIIPRVMINTLGKVIVSVMGVVHNFPNLLSLTTGKTNGKLRCPVKPLTYMYLPEWQICFVDKIAFL